MQIQASQGKLFTTCNPVCPPARVKNPLSTTYPCNFCLSRSADGGRFCHPGQTKLFLFVQGLVTTGTSDAFKLVVRTGGIAHFSARSSDRSSSISLSLSISCRSTNHCTFLVTVQMMASSACDSLCYVLVTVMKSIRVTVRTTTRKDKIMANL